MGTHFQTFQLQLLIDGILRIKKIIYLKITNAIWINIYTEPKTKIT